MDWENIDTMDRDNIPTISWTNIMEMERVGESIEEEEESISSKKSLYRNWRKSRNEGISPSLEDDDKKYEEEIMRANGD